MTRAEAIAHLGPRYVLSAHYQPQPHHSSYAEVDVRITWARVRHRMRQTEHSRQGIRLEPSGRSDNQLSDSSAYRAVSNSFVGAVEEARQKMRLVFGRAA